MRRHFNKIALLLTTIFMVACATSPEGDASNTESVTTQIEPTVTPDEVSFDHPKANLMYGILLGEIANQRGYTDIAIKQYLKAAKQSQDPQVAARAVQIARFANAEQETLEAAKIWSTADPSNQEAIRVLAVLHLRNGDYEEAKKELETLLVNNPDASAQTFINIGTLLQREASDNDATEITEYLANAYPDNPEAHYIAAKIALTSKKYDIALQRIDKTMALRPDWVDAVVLKSRILQQTGDIDASLRYLETYLKKQPDDDAVRFRYARLLIDAKQLEKARNQFELLAVKMPGNEDVLFTLAMLSLQFNELNESQGYLKQLYNAGRRNPRILYYLGQIAEQKKEDEKALDWYAQVRRGDFYFEAQLRIAAVLEQAKSLNDALEHLHALQPATLDKQRELILFEGSLLRNHKRFQEAFDLYSNALADKLPDDTEILFSRSLVAERLDNLEVTIRDLRSIIEKEPNHAAALNALGYTLADRTNRYQEALELINRALTIEPNDPAIIDSLGWVQFRIGNHEEAIKHLRKALEMAKDGEIAAHLGEALWGNGQKQEAITIWNKAYDAFNDNDILRSTMERFGQLPKRISGPGI